MPSWLAHVPAALGVASVAAPTHTSRRYWVVAGLCGIIPDLDYAGAPFGNLAYSNYFGGHRGFTHGLLFAALLGGLLAWGAFRDARWDGSRLRLALALALATSTHGLLDALTDVGPAVAFFSPFAAERYTFPWHPIDPSAAAKGRGLGGIALVLANELTWSALPALALAAVGAWGRRYVVARRRA
jgi:inner membrane protein